MPGSSHEERMKRARLSLDGLSMGDAFGIYAYNRFLELPPGPRYWTDDTNMALSIVEVLGKYGRIEQGALAASFAAHYDVERGYGAGMDALLRDRAYVDSWETSARSLFGGQGSFGNGSAMRVTPVGAYYADDLTRIAGEASRSSVVTHAHPEAVAGAVAVAVAAGLAWQWREPSSPGRAAFIDALLPHVPDSSVRGGLITARDLLPGTTPLEAAAVLGNGMQVSCQDTVPFVVWCAGECLYDFEQALWMCGSARGDRDTTCAMVGGIVVMYAGEKSIPLPWMKRREPLPEWILTDEQYRG